MAKRWGGTAWWVLGALVLLSLAGAACAYLIRQRSMQAELAEARAAFAGGHFALASSRLSRLAERWTGDGEVYLLLGQCELERGRNEPPERRAEAQAAATRALEAWSRIPRSSPFHDRGSLLRATHLINTGHYTPAEETLLQALGEPHAALRYELERALSRLYRFQGRFDEVRELVRGAWSRSPTPAGDLKELWTLDHSPMPVEAWKKALENADGDDDRVWLGRASVAITTGNWAEAGPWLDRCILKRPDDPAVWRARLELAVASQDEAGFWPAVAQLPAADFDPAAVLELRAWLMAVRRDPAAEERELRALVGADLGNTKALERLAVLMVGSGRVKESEDWHRRKAVVDRAHDTYRKALFDGDDLSSRAGALADLDVDVGPSVRRPGVVDPG